jgi:hypothetical protein
VTACNGGLSARCVAGVRGSLCAAFYRFFLGRRVYTSLALAAWRPGQLPVDHVTLGSFRIVLSETMFADVARTFGAAPVVHTGDAGDSRVQACYRPPGANQPTYYLVSDEMGGGERITQFEALSAGATTVAEDSLLASQCGVGPRWPCSA